MAEIGVGLVSGGVFFLALGVIMFFDATLLAMATYYLCPVLHYLLDLKKLCYFSLGNKKFAALFASLPVWVSFFCAGPSLV